MKILLLVSQGDETLDASDQILIAHLRKVGFDVSIVCWEGLEPIAIESSATLFFRSIVSSYKRFELFEATLQKIRERGCYVANDVQTLIWNIDKRHLTDLVGAGYFSPHTIVCSGTSESLVDAIERVRTDNCVLKPRYGGSGEGVVRLHRLDADATVRCLDLSPYKKGALVQEYIKEIEAGEYSLIFIDGALSHSVLKRPKKGEFRVNAQYGPEPPRLVRPDSVLVESAEDLLTSIPGKPVIVRVDCTLTQGRLCCIELETVDPNLYFDLYPEGAALLARSLRERHENNALRQRVP